MNKSCITTWAVGISVTAMKMCLVLCFISTLAIAQSKSGKGGGSTSPSGADASAGGGGSSVTIESQMMAYKAVGEAADKIVSSTVKAVSQTPASSSSPIKILYQDPIAMSAMAASYSFDSTVSALVQSYQSAAAGSGPLAAPSPTDWISAAVGALSAFRNTSVYSGQTFQPDDTVLLSFLRQKFHTQKMILVAADFPGNLEQVQRDVISELQSLTDERNKVPEANRKAFFNSLDQQLAALQSALMTADSSGATLLTTIIKGKALIVSLKGPGYLKLSAKTVATGGGSRTNHNFWVELVYTTPKPSYNGGAIVTYSLYDYQGAYMVGGVEPFVYDYLKWKANKVHEFKKYKD